MRASRTEEVKIRTRVVVGLRRGGESHLWAVPFTYTLYARWCPTQTPFTSSVPSAAAAGVPAANGSQLQHSAECFL